MSPSYLVGRRVRLLLAPEQLPGSLAIRLTSDQLHRGPQGVIMGIEGCSRDLELGVLIDGCEQTYPFHFDSMQML